jgi:YrbI family 3-deoxy-D-manno-octulosonate 8-phosphate phosphatase
MLANGIPAAIQAVIIDVDGVLTNGLKFYSDSGSRGLSFNVKDGVAFSLLEEMNVCPIVISASNFDCIRARMGDLNVKNVALNCSDKLLAATNILNSLQVQPDAVAVIGDDIGDLPLFDYCGLSVAPSDAVERVRARADVVLKSRGGEGVLREFYEKLIRHD